MPIIPDITGIPVWIVNLSVFVVFLVLYPRAYTNPVIYWFLAYATILAIYVLLGKPLTIGIGDVHDSKKIIIEYAFFLPSLSIFSILYYLNDFRIFKIISFFSLVFIVLSFSYLIPMILIKNTILRDALYLAQYNNIETFAIPNYSLMHAYIIALPAILYCLKTYKSWEKWVMMLAITVMSVFIIIHTYITTSIVVTFSVIVFALLFTEQNIVKSFLFIFPLFFIIYILHLYGVFVQLFDSLIEYFNGTAVQHKIETFKYIYLNGYILDVGESITARMNYHAMSWKAFSENILIGGSSPVGNHSSLIDRLGGMGLLAFIPFIMIILSQIKMSLKVLKNTEQRIFYYLGVVSAFAILYQKGLFGQEGWLFMMVLLPGIIIMFRNEKSIQMKKGARLSRNIFAKNHR